MLHRAGQRKPIGGQKDQLIDNARETMRNRRVSNRPRIDRRTALLHDGTVYSLYAVLRRPRSGPTRRTQVRHHSDMGDVLNDRARAMATP